MRGRIWIFAVLVAAALAVHLALLSAKVAQSGEDNVRARLALATSALRAQLELLDARLSPRAVASAPDLVEATRAPADPAQPLSRPDDRALRAAASALSPEPDLLAVVNGQGAIVSRRAKAAQGMDDAAPLPLAKAALEGNPAPSFAMFDGSVYRAAAARVPGNGAAAVVGMLVDDRLAAQFKSQVDADVTFLQAGKVLASSLPAGDARLRLVRWAAAPSPGYGVLPIHLPLIGDELSGKLPRGATRYAVRGALLPIDSGVQAALTVPAAPYLAWLGRYQAFYLVALVLFLLFSIVWGLLARVTPAAPAPASRRVTEPVVTPVPRRAAPALLGTDVGEPRSAPPPSDDVPWPAAEPVEVAQKAPAPPTESLDPEVPAPAAPGSASQHPMWSADPFTPTPEPLEGHSEPEVVSAEEVGLVEAAPPPPEEEEEAEEVPPADAPGLHAANSHPPPPAEAHAAAAGEPVGKESSAARGDFSFAGLLDEAHGATAPHNQSRPALAQDYPDTTNPGRPSDELLAKARGGGLEDPSEPAPFPGDEPTLVEPVSAALLDKLRERDEEPAAGQEEPAPPPPPEQGWGSLVSEGDGDRTAVSGPPEMEATQESQPVAEANVTMQDFSMPAVDAQDPDESHWRETYDKFRELKTQLGEPADRISFAKFATKLRKNRADLLAKHNCKGVRFSVYEKDGKAAIKASAIR